MPNEKRDDLEILDELKGLTESQSELRPGKTKANFQAEKLEERVLFSATWIDADSGDDLSSSTSNADAYTGSSSNDRAYAGDGNDILDGLEGNDLLFGQGGDDVINGGEGNDHIWGGEGADTLDGGEGHDFVRYDYDTNGVNIDLSTQTVSGGNAEGDQISQFESAVGGKGDDVIQGSDEANRLYGRVGNDQIAGLDGNDYLFGEDGDDILDAGDGNDRVYGGTGTDQIDGGEGNDHIWGGAGADTLDGGEGLDYVRYDQDTTGVNIDLSTQTVSGGHAEGDQISGFENALGGQSDDVIQGSDEANRLYGRAGDDQIAGLDGNDYLYGEDGDDILDAGDGNDRVYGGSGTDQITGGEGNDLLYGQDGIDVIDGGEGNDHIWGGAGADTLDGGEGLDYVRYDQDTTGVNIDLSTQTVSGGHAEGDQISGFENALGGQSDDVIQGSDEANRLYGRAGDDQIAGLDGNDYLFGEDGDDILDAGDGNDRVYGGSGTDQITGGEGNDLLYGGEGFDTANFSGKFSDYEITDLGNGRFVVEDIRPDSPDGRDTLTNVERLVFSDGVASLENSVDFNSDSLKLEGGVVEENSAPGTLVGELGDGSISYSYEIVDENGNVAQDSNFEIDGNLIRVADGADINFEENNTMEIQVRSTDDGGNQYVEVIEIQILDANDGPTANSDSGALLRTAEDTELSIPIESLLANDFDEDGDSISFKSVQDATHGTVELDGDGNITFTPDENFSGTASFTYTIETADGLESTATAFVDVEPVNDAVTDIRLTANASLVAYENFEGGAEGWSNNTTTLQGELTEFLGRFGGSDGQELVSKTFEFDSNHDYAIIEFDFLKIDSWDSNNPWGLEESLNVFVDGQEVFSFAPEGNDYGTELGRDSATGTNGNITYVVTSSGDDIGLNGNNDHSSNWQERIYKVRLEIREPGEDITLGFGSTLNQDIGDESFGIDNVSVVGAESPATVLQEDGSFTMPASSVIELPENSPAGTVVAEMTSTDVDDDDNHTYEIVDADGNVVEDDHFEIFDNQVVVKDGADLDFEARQSHELHIRVTDSGGSQHTERIAINVNDVNEGQIAQGESYNIQEDGSITGNLLANDLDLDGDELQIESFGQPTNGTVDVNPDGGFNYQPNENFSGTDSFTYTITDGNGATSTQTVNIDVAAVADAALLEISSASGDEDTAIDLDISARLADIDGSESIERITISNVPQGAVLSAGIDNGDGSWTLETSDLVELQITPAENSHDNFRLDVDVATADRQPIVIDNPGFEADALAESRWNYSAQGWEKIGSAGTWDTTTSHFGELDETEQIAWANTNANSISGFGQTLAESFDSSKSYELSVDIGNRFDAQSLDSSFEVRLMAGDRVVGSIEGSTTDFTDGTMETISLNVDGRDFESQEVDGATLRIEILNTGSQSAGTGQVNFDNVRLDRIESLSSVSQTMTVEVAAVNDATTDLQISNSTIAENSPAGTVVGTLSATDVDDGETFSYDIVDANGNVVEDANFEVVDNQIVVKSGADLNFEASQSHEVNIRVTDSGGSQHTEQIAINIANVNEGQIVEDESFEILEDGSVSGNLLANDVDLDGDELQIASFEQPANGAVTVSSDGSFNYQPNENFSGTDSFNYTITDGNGQTSTQMVEINVVAVADAAQLEIRNASGNEDTDIDLDISAILVDIDGSERIDSIIIRNLPEGAMLSSGTENGDGSWSLETAELDGLQIAIAENSHDDFQLDIEVTTVDGNSTQVVHSSLAVEVAAVNDAVTDLQVTNTTIAENTPAGTVVGTLSATDIDVGETFTYDIVDSSGNLVEDANFEIVNDQIVVRQDANLNFESSQSHELMIRVTDSGGATHTEGVSIEITDVNEGPTATGETFTIKEDSQLQGNLLANDSDVDNDQLSISQFDQPANGTVTVLPSGDFNYQPDENFSGTDSFSYEVSDGKGGTATETVTIEVEAVADSAQLNVSNASGNEDTAIDLSIDASLFDTDNSEEISVIRISGLPQGAELSSGIDNGDGSWSLNVDELQGLQVSLDGYGNEDFELRVEVTTTDGDSEFTRVETLSVELQHDSLIAGMLQQLESGDAGDQPVVNDSLEFSESKEDAFEDDSYSFQSAYTEISQLSQELSDFNDESIWNQPGFASMENEFEDIREGETGQQPLDEIDSPQFEFETFEMPARDGLELSQVEEFDHVELSEIPVEIDGIDRFDESIDSAGFTTASLLLLFTKREDSRRKLLKLQRNPTSGGSLKIADDRSISS